MGAGDSTYGYMDQNAVQNVGGGEGDTQDSVALGKISVNCIGKMVFQIE